MPGTVPVARRAVEFGFGLAVLVVAWQLAAAQVANATLLPAPARVATAWLGMARAELWSDVLASLVHLGLGYGLGATAGLALAMLCARSEVLDAIVDPLVELLRPIGAIAWIPLAILIFGVGAGVPVFLIFYAALFPIFLNTLAGIRQVDPALVHAARSLGASPRLVVTHVVLPAAMPLVVAGARLSLGFAWFAMVAAELTGADSGLGWRLFWYQEFFAMDRVLAVILTIGVLGYTMDLGLRALQRRLTGWQPGARTEDA